METTGLSGGAGTIAFLVGLARASAHSLTVDQFFLYDYPGEETFLDIVLTNLDGKKTYVSYNGKAFDTQILKTRCIMNGRSLPIREQLDLLYPARRLWKEALPACNLGIVEEHILHLHRQNDVPGMEVPEIYFSFLKTGDSRDLERVFAHHLQDIVSLERLLRHITTIFIDLNTDPLASRMWLGRWLLDTGFREGEGILGDAFEKGDMKAGHHLARHLKRRGALSEAARIWVSMYERGGELSAAFELVKYSEHKLKDYQSAEYYASRLLEATRAEEQSVPESYERLEHRIARIRRKAKNSGYL